MKDSGIDFSSALAQAVKSGKGNWLCKADTMNEPFYLKLAVDRKTVAVVYCSEDRLHSADVAIGKKAEDLYEQVVENLRCVPSIIEDRTQA